VKAKRKLTQRQIDAAEGRMLDAIATACAREHLEITKAQRRFTLAYQEAIRRFEAIEELARTLEREARK